jgi:zinc transporter, ZIP family
MVYISPIFIAAIYALLGDVLATFLAATVAVIVRHRVSSVAVGTALGISGGFIMGAAFLDIIAEAQRRSNNTFAIAGGLAIGLLLMIIINWAVNKYGIGEDEEMDDEKNGTIEKQQEPDRLQKATMISIGMGVHNVPEALPIGAALVISPSLSLLVTLLMTVETFAESGSITGELIQGKASPSRIYGLTMWPSVLSMIGAPIGVILAGISPVFLALTLGLAAGVMLFITGEVWGDSREDAGISWSSIGLLVGLVLAMLTAISI